MVTASEIKKLCPSAKVSLVNAIVDNWDYAELVGNIVTPLRVQHFMSQIAVETAGLKSVSESLNYSVEGLLKTFGRHRITEAQAKKYGRTANRAANQTAIANIIYGGEWGKKNLGNTQTGDGWKFRGGGMMQTTGRANYRKMGYENNPEGLRDPVEAFKSAVREWANRGCNELADRDDLKAIRKKINGGTNGLSETEAYLKKAKGIFKSDGAPNEADLVRQVQDLLWDKGYPEVGESDGKMGPRTRNAILAFQADNGLPLTGKITDSLLAALVKAPKRKMDSTRENATADDLKGESAVQDGNWLKRIGAGIFAVSGLGGIMDGTGSLQTLAEGAGQMKVLIDNVAPFLPWLLLGVGGFAVYYFGKRIIASQVEAYREGRAL